MGEEGERDGRKARRNEKRSGKKMQGQGELAWGATSTSYLVCNRGERARCGGKGEEAKLYEYARARSKCDVIFFTM